MRIHLPILAILATASATFAQKDLENIPPPKPPFVSPVPARCAWTVVADLPPQKPEADKASIQLEASVNYTKTGEITRRVATYTTGAISETWYIGTYYLWKPEGQDPIVNDSAGEENSHAAGIGRVFPGVSWVSTATYDKPLTFEKQTCYHYKSAEREAWIACESSLPVAYTEGVILYRYTFLPAPTAQLQLPPDYQAAWDAAQKIVQRRIQLQNAPSR